MVTKVYSAATVGINAKLIEIETHYDERGIPNFSMVGLTEGAVKESSFRVFSAIKNSGLDSYFKRVVINLAPADMRKDSSALDLPIAIGLLSGSSQVPQDLLPDTIFLGELALDGGLRTIHGVLPITLEARARGMKRIVLSKMNAAEAALVDGIDVIAVETLSDVINYLANDAMIEPFTINREELFNRNGAHLPDFSEVKGQENVKRALEVAAAGGHNAIMIGPPGSGKTMLAKRIPSILPPMSFEEALEVTKIHSVSGLLPHGEALVTTRPFRSPHHTISDAALCGGGMGVVRAGEISFSHHGVLFMDELPEFARNVLEVLRQPLEDGHITISRTKMTVEFPANFMLMCAMNPCPCGHFGNPRGTCTCTPQQIQRYMARVSGPLLDRIDLHVEAAGVEYRELATKAAGEESKHIRERVVNARNIQRKRFEGKKGLYKNADMSSKDIREYCKIGEDSDRLMKMAMTRLGLSARAYDRILKVSRTIADLAREENILPTHVSEAIQYRSLDREYWNA